MHLNILFVVFSLVCSLCHCRCVLVVVVGAVVSAVAVAAKGLPNSFAHVNTFCTLHIRVNYFARAYRIQGYNRAHIIFRWMRCSLIPRTHACIQEQLSLPHIVAVNQSNQHEPTSSIIEIWFNSHFNNFSLLHPHPPSPLHHTFSSLGFVVSISFALFLWYCCFSCSRCVCVRASFFLLDGTFFSVYCFLFFFLSHVRCSAHWLQYTPNRLKNFFRFFVYSCDCCYYYYCFSFCCCRRWQLFLLNWFIAVVCVCVCARFPTRIIIYIMYFIIIHFLHKISIFFLLFHSKKTKMTC